MIDNEPREAYLPSTSWSLLQQMLQGGDGAKKAAAIFYSRYHEPVYRYLLAIVRNKENAEDLAHDFLMSKILAGNLVARVDPTAKGGFRPFLKTSLINFARSRFLKEKSKQPVENIEQVHAALDTPEPEQEFYDACIRNVVHGANARLREECLADGLAQHYELFHARYIVPLTEDEEPPSWRALGDKFGLDEKTARNRADTVLARYRRIVREMLKEEVGSDEAARKEFDFLRSGASMEMVKLWNLTGAGHSPDSLRAKILEVFGEDQGSKLMAAVCNPDTLLDDLHETKELGKKQANRAESKGKKEGASCMYYAAIGAAFALYGENISSFPMTDRLPVFKNFARELEGDPLGKIFEQAIARVGSQKPVKTKGSG